MISNVNRFRLLLCCISVSILLSGCDLRRLAGTNPELFAKEYLEKHGYSSNVVTALLNYAPIEDAVISDLIGLDSVDVRHMLGRNLHLTPEQRSALLFDEDEYVRAGIAMNPNLSIEEIERLKDDPDLSVLYGLCMNPFVPKDVLLYMRNVRGVSLSAFAKNPLCPEEIVFEIERSGTQLQKDLREIGVGQGVNGLYLGRSFQER